MNTNFNFRWSNPLLHGENVNEQFKKAYGDSSDEIKMLLEDSPYEIVVLTRLLAYLNSIMEV